MVDIEIKRGYEVLSDNNVRFGIRVINNSSFAIMDVEVILDYSEDSFKLQGDRIYKFGTIPPSVPRTAKFVLQPKGCIHKDELGATVLYKDHEWNKHVEQMRPKEVHCVCPFLKEKSISRAEFLILSKSGYSAESGVNFENIDSGRVVGFLSRTCKNRLYEVEKFPVDGGSIIYLAGDAVGEKAYYLLTAVVKNHEGLTQVFLRGNSDKDHGLTGFLNETLDNLRHLVVAGKVREIGVIRKEQVINIIDSVVQRTEFGADNDKRVKKEHEKAEGECKANSDKEELCKKQDDEKEMLRRQDGINIWQNSKRIVEIKTTQFLNRKKEIQKSIFMGLGKKTDFVDIFIEKEVENQIEVRRNTIDMKFALIHAGEFMMGSPTDEKGRRGFTEGPVHKVTIYNPFYLSTYPVTQREWKTVMGNNPSHFKGDDLPVEQVSWDDVQKFIKKLNEAEGTDKYRLPSEAEWEYACRAGTTARYSFGDNELRLGEYSWYGGNSSNETHPVGQKKPNIWGLYDMHGNVLEWTQDWYYDSYKGAPTDGIAWESGGSGRVNRAGSWHHGAHNCRSAFRGSSFPSSRDYDLVFRLLMAP